MRNNYKSWFININDFYSLTTDDDRIKFLLNFAILAPSSHNSQPWKFVVEDRSIGVIFDRDRALAESDKNDRQSYLSLGCAIKNIEIAANYYGYGSTIDYVFNNRVANIYVDKKSNMDPKESHLLPYIMTRTTNRNKYDMREIPQLLNSIMRDFTNSEMKIDIITDNKKREKIADICINSMLTAMDNFGFRTELSLYVKNNLTSKKIGMPAFGLGIPTPVSFLVPIMLKYINLEKLSKQRDLSTFKKHTPAFVLISTKEDNPKTWLTVGRIYEYFALLAESYGLNTAPWQAPVQIDDFYHKIQDITQDDFRPQFLFRIGYALTKTPKSPRLGLDDVMQK